MSVKYTKSKPTADQKRWCEAMDILCEAFVKKYRWKLAPPLLPFYRGKKGAAEFYKKQIALLR